MTEPSPWLTPAELAAWVNLARMMELLPGALDRQLRDEAGIPHVYYQMLAMLSEAPDQAMRMTDLARLSATTTSRLSHAVASLEQRGWVTRRPCRFDKRGQICELTDEGMATVVAAAPGHAAEVRRLVFDRLSGDDVANLRAITDKIMPGLTCPSARS